METHTHLEKEIDDFILKNIDYLTDEEIAFYKSISPKNIVEDDSK